VALQGDLLAGLTEYWIGQLSGAPARLALPTDRPRRDVQRHEGAHPALCAGEDDRRRWSMRSRVKSARRCTCSLAAFVTLLYRLTGEDDVVVGSPIANRTHAELAEVSALYPTPWLCG